VPRITTPSWKPAKALFGLDSGAASCGRHRCPDLGAHLDLWLGVVATDVEDDTLIRLGLE
jgi:hypothetical protein